MQRLARGGKLELRLGVSRYNDGGVGETLEALAARAETKTPNSTKQSWCSALIEGCGGWEKKYEGEGARLLLADGRLGRLGWRRCSWLERGWLERAGLALSCRPGPAVEKLVL